VTDGDQQNHDQNWRSDAPAKWDMIASGKDAEGDVEQMGDHDGAGPVSQNTDYIHMDRGLPH